MLLNKHFQTCDLQFESKCTVKAQSISIRKQVVSPIIACLCGKYFHPNHFLVPCDPVKCIRLEHWISVFA